MDFTEQRLPPNPAEKANFLSKLFFIWIMPLFKKGYSKDLEVEDLYDVLKGDQAKHLGDKLERLVKSLLFNYFSSLMREHA